MQLVSENLRFPRTLTRTLDTPYHAPPTKRPPISHSKRLSYAPLPKAAHQPAFPKAPNHPLTSTENMRVPIRLPAIQNPDQKFRILQNSFNVFLKKKNSDESYKTYTRLLDKNQRKTPEHKASLRKKFVETAKRYFGIPYKKKYQEPESDLHRSPLFLDCCGLVRQVVYDLREDFGFQLGKGNQSYQFDMLPGDLEAGELKPGDLIFYSGAYNAGYEKFQKHDMVHIEIFVGGSTGEASIGARWGTGVVQVWPSYKFEGKRWTVLDYHYKSIDTWLDGVLKSWCVEHPDPVRTVKDSSENLTDEKSTCEENLCKNDESSRLHLIKDKTVLVGNGNNDKLVKKFFHAKGWTILDNLYGKNYKLKWVTSVHDNDYISFISGRQIINH